MLDPVRHAGIGFVDRSVAPAIVAAFAVGGFGEVAKRVSELSGALLEAELGQCIEVAVDGEVTLFDQTIEITDTVAGLDAEEPFDHRRIDDVTESFAAQPIHDLQNFASPIEHL